MSKELTPLEALEKVGKQFEVYISKDTIVSYNITEDYLIIKKALKENIALKKVNEFLQEDYQKLEEKFNNLKRIIKEPDTTIKQLKTLEIIKKKFVNLEDLNDAIYEDNYHQNNEHNAIDIYNQNRFEYKQLTQEEYDLLKEALL